MFTAVGATKAAAKLSSRNLLTWPSATYELSCNRASDKLCM